MEITEKLEKLVEFSKKHGIKRFKTEEFEIEFDLSFKYLPGVVDAVDNKELNNLHIVNEEKVYIPTEDEFLYWSSDYDPQVRTEGSN